MKPTIKTERTGSLYRVTCEAPSGFVWNAGRVHELVAEGRGTNSQEARRDIRQRVALGLSKCDTPDCDWCNGY